MNVLSFPIRLAADGSFATVEQHSTRHAQEIAAVCLATRYGQMPLAPLYGTPELVAGESPELVAAAIEAIEPGLHVDSVNAELGPDGLQQVSLAVRWEDS